MNISPAGALRALRHALAGPDVPPTRPRWPRASRYAGPVGLLVLVGLLAINVAYLTDPRHRPLPVGVAWLLSLITVAPLAALPWRPLLAWRLAMVALLVCTFNARPEAPWPWSPLLVMVTLLVVFVTALCVDRDVLLWVGLITTVPVVVFVNRNNAPGVLMLLAVVMVLGHLVRRNRLSRTALVAQTELSELERARRAVLEERTRIAREMHDVVAHHMSMIAVQAETAPYRLNALSEPARAEFTSVAATAREALTDMRRLLGVLRSESTGPETAPQPGLAEIPELVAAARRAGMTVRFDGPPEVPVPDAVGLAAYRIVQEALANAARHAPGAPVSVALTSVDDTLRLTVTDSGAPAADSDSGPPAVNARGSAADAGPVRSGGGGHGLTGMRERARLLGGTFSARRDGSGFTITADLPLTREDSRT